MHVTLTPRPRSPLLWTNAPEAYLFPVEQSNVNVTHGRWKPGYNLECHFDVPRNIRLVHNPPSLQDTQEDFHGIGNIGSP